MNVKYTELVRCDPAIAGTVKASHPQLRTFTSYSRLIRELVDPRQFPRIVIENRSLTGYCRMIDR